MKRIARGALASAATLFFAGGRKHSELLQGEEIFCEPRPRGLWGSCSLSTVHRLTSC
jgi:hypothetical protein